MNGNDKLSDRLKRMRVPASPNPRHEAALRMELERLAAQPAASPLPGASRNQRPADPARGRTIRGVFSRPALPVMGAVAAAAVVIGIFFFRQSPPSAPVELARGAAASLVVMQSGELAAERAAERTALQSGDSFRPFDRISAAEGAWGVLRIDDSIFVKLEPGAALTWRANGVGADGRRRIGLELETGFAHFVTRRFDGVLTVSAGGALFETLGTSFSVTVDPRRVTLSVVAGAVRASGAAPGSRVLRESVRKDETLVLTAAGTLAETAAETATTVPAAVTDAARRECGRLLAVAEGLAGEGRSRDDSARPLRLTIEAQPVDAVIVLDDGWQAAGRLSFMARKGENYGITVSAAGHITHTARLEANEEKTMSIVLEKEKRSTLSPAPVTARPILTPVPSAVPRDRESSPWERRTARPVPRLTLVPTGAPADWRGTAPMVDDPAGDANLADAGADAAALYLARDDRTLWIGIRFANGLPEATGRPETVLTLLADTGDRLVITCAAADGGFRVRAALIAAGRDEAVPAGEAAVKSGTSFLEAGLLFDGWGAFLKPGGKYELSLSLSLQKYGRLRVVSDRTETVLVGF